MAEGLDAEGAVLSGEPFPDLVALKCDGSGGATPIGDGLVPEEPGYTWLHVLQEVEEARRVLRGAGLADFVVDALTAEETRPRCTVHGDGVLLFLRGVNLSPGAEPEDMVSVRLWLERRRVVGVSMRPLHALSDILAACEAGRAPRSPGDFVARLALRLTDRAEPAVSVLNEAVDTMEEEVLDRGRETMRSGLGSIRRKAIRLRRFLLPQRDALTTLEIEDFGWLDDRDRSRLREAAERVFRLGDDLDAIRDRAQVIYDEISDERAERLNNRMLLLALVAAVFLPPTLLTGLLGMNVGGIPGTNSPLAFWIVLCVVAVLGAGVVFWMWARAFFR